MSVRQYVGARYVPRFSPVNGGVWDNSYSYEALEIVKYGNDYYTSKKPVPTGVAISNTEYWVLTGNYNGAIANLDDKIDAVDTKVDAVDDKVDALHNLNMLRGNILFIGDSYITTLATSWADYVGTWLGKVKNTSYFVSAMGGTGFAAIAGGKNFTSLINEASISEPDKITCVIIQGGANDIYPANRPNIIDGIASAVSAVKQRFPNASVVIGECEGWIDATYNWVAREDLYVKYAEGCARNGALFLGATGTGLKLFRSSYLQSDLKHPSDNGMKDIAIRTLNYLNGVKPHTKYTQAGNYYFKEDGDDVIIEFLSNANFTVSETDFVCDGSHSILVQSTGTVVTGIDNYGVYMGICHIRTTDNKYYQMPCRIEITNDGFKLTPKDYTADHANFVTISIQQISISAGNSFRVIGYLIN